MAAKLSISERHIDRDQVGSEIRRLEAAVTTTDNQFARAHDQLEARSDHAGAELAEAYRLMARDPELIGHCRALIETNLCGAEWAVRQAIDHMRGSFGRTEDPYLIERARDFEDVGQLLLRALLGLPEGRPGEGELAGAVVLAPELSLLQVFQLHRAGAAGLVSETGGKTSHAAILARSLGLTYVTGVEPLTSVARPGELLIVDGFRGEVIPNPSDEILAHYDSRRRHWHVREKTWMSTRALRAITRDGMTVRITANVERIMDIPRAIDAGAEGVGLFRTELLYLDAPDLPTEEEHLRDAIDALKSLGGRPATFRTLDVGAGKLPAGLRLPHQPNPALGIRSIRFSLRRPEMFRTQVRALYRASAFGPLRIMFPLISSSTELSEVLALCAEVREELRRADVDFDPHVPLGVMIETPSAALTADHLARHADFLSIGTNDLIQYTLAADRDNDDVAYLSRPLHPSVLRLLKSVVEAAREADRPLSICGDMAGEALYTWVLLGLGLRDLSMLARNIPAIKAVVRETLLADAQDLVAQTLALDSESEIEALVLETMRIRLPSHFPDPDA
jgi:phosphoenolpyruvate-protein phosphotransferase (PTS system enzyme I)